MATIAAASSINESATPPKSVPSALVWPGMTILVRVTDGSGIRGSGDGARRAYRRTGAAARAGRTAAAHARAPEASMTASRPLFVGLLLVAAGTFFLASRPGRA